MIQLDVEQSLVSSEHRLSKKDILSFSHAFHSQFPDMSGQIALAFVGDARIQMLNRVYRHKDAVTDVLSFTYSLAPGDHLGDIVISYPQMLRQAEAGDVRLEMIDLIVHGMLHVLGYDHELPRDASVMFPLQDSLVATII